MEVIAHEIAKILNVSFETAVNMYPVIRQQFVTYNIVDSVNGFAWIVFIIISVVIVGMVFSGIDNSYFSDAGKDLREVDDSKYGNWHVESENKEIMFARKFMRWFKMAVFAFGSSIILISVTSMLKYVVAPDYSILLKLLS